MNSPDKNTIPKLIWLMIIGSGFTRGAFFMAFPFLAIHLKNHFNADLTTIGWIIGVGPLAGTLVGFYGAYLSDVFGRRVILVASLLVWGAVQASFSIAGALWVFWILSALSGVLRAISEPIVQAVISDRVTGDARTRAYHYRYYAINVGAVVGPLIGSWVLLTHPTLGFVIAGISLVIFALVFAWMVKDEPVTRHSIDRPPGFFKVMGIMMRDKVLTCYVMGAILCALAHTQTDSTLPIILESIMGREGIKVYGWVLVANGLTIVCFQLLINRLTKRFEMTRAVAASCLVFALSFVGFAYSGDMPWAYILSMVVLALGEILVFSNGIVLIDRLAPENIKATYHSAGNLFSVGMAFGPPLGGWLLSKTDPTILFWAAAVLLVLAGGSYYWGGQIQEAKE